MKYKIEVDDISNEDNPEYFIFDILTDKDEVYITVFNDGLMATKLVEMLNNGELSND